MHLKPMSYSSQDKTVTSKTQSLKIIMIAAKSAWINPCTSACVSFCPQTWRFLSKLVSPEAASTLDEALAMQSRAVKTLIERSQSNA